MNAFLLNKVGVSRVFFKLPTTETSFWHIEPASANL